MLATLFVLGAGALGGGGFALAREFTRKPTKAEVETAGAQELAFRWRIRTVGEIFPETVRYSFADRGDRSPAVRLRTRRVGIATSTGCADAVDEQVADILLKHGCKALLRATYVDASGTLVTTIGLAVLPDSGKAASVESDVGAISGISGKRGYGLRALGFPGTVTERFGDAQRQKLWLTNNGTPYVFFSANGWTDGRPTLRQRELVERFDFADALTNHLIATFGRSDEPCTMQGVRC